MTNCHWDVICGIKLCQHKLKIRSSPVDKEERTWWKAETQKSHLHLLPFSFSEMAQILCLTSCKVNKSSVHHHKKITKAFNYQEVCKSVTEGRRKFNPSVLLQVLAPGSCDGCSTQVVFKASLSVWSRHWKGEQSAVRGQQVAVWTLEARCVKTWPKSESFYGRWNLQGETMSNDLEMLAGRIQVWRCQAVSSWSLVKYLI